MSSKVRIAVAVTAACVALSGGGIALAATTGTSSPSSPAAKAGAGHHAHGLLHRALHAQWVTRDAKTGTDTTHDAIRGVVTSVGATSITVKSADGVTAAFGVTSTSKVRVQHKAGQISAVRAGDSVLVVGTGTGPFVATVVADRGVPSTSTRRHASPTASSTGAAQPTPTVTS